MRPFFVLSSARAGSTSLARILDQASNGSCAVEPVPNLNVESRLALEGRLAEPKTILEQSVLPRVKRAGNRIYGEKNVTYAPFVGLLHELCDARFVLLTRDGRDVVRSLIDWHDRLFGTVYREAIDPGELSAVARRNAANLLVHLDSSDFARPRPLPGEPLYERWPSATRFEMCVYYWARIYDLYLDQLALLPEGSWIQLDYTRAGPDDLLHVADFLELQGLDRANVASMLDARINSLKDRCDEAPTFPDWTQWNSAQRRDFETIAGPTMRRLNYWTDNATHWRPPAFGACWRERAADLAWYEWMYEGRRRMHDDAISWIRSHDSTDRINSIMDFGCGVGVGYSSELADRTYIGVDLAENSIAWARQHRTNPGHRYLALDFIADPPAQAADLVMSSGTIDNAYDPERYLDAMIAASRRWIYVTCYRGWFPELTDHRFFWSSEHGCYYADLSPSRMREHLERRGCTHIAIEPRSTGRTDIPYETRLIARVSRRSTA